MTAETTSAAEDFKALKLTTEEEEAGAVIEIDVPDDTDPGELEAALTRALAAQDGDTQTVFDDAAEFLAVENLETGGLWVECPFIPGHAIQVRSGAVARSKYSKLERKYRVENKLMNGEDLSVPVQEGLLRESMFETSMRDWRGFAPNGSEWPFDLAHYRKLWAKSRWRNWAMVQIGSLGGDDSPALEQVRGN